MSRRLRRRRADDDGQAAARIAVLTKALEKAADDRRVLRADLEAALKHADADRYQLDWHKTELSKAMAALNGANIRIHRAERLAETRGEQIRAAREEHAEHCPHTAEVRDLKATLAALERRVHELQQANEGRYRREYHAVHPEQAPAAVPAVLRALGRKAAKS